MEHKVIGKILGNRYRILRELGSGGMAWVYLAEDINEGRLVAIKILYPQFSEDLAYIQRFNREAKLASTLTDPHIVRVLDYGATRDVHYLVMEYIEGQNLRSVIDEHGSLSWREALGFLDQLAVALEHAHLHGVVHRDIKPQNLMITEDGTLKVLDFGIARIRMLASLTQSGFVGSPYYISPEQAMGEEVDIRSDIYSAGVVLYEMLSGRVPYDAASPWSIISQHIASEPPRIDLRGTETPASTETLLHRMIAKRPEDRFQTPAALREAIASVLAGRSLPELLDIQTPPVPDRVATAEGLYQRARQAMEEEDWQRAVDLLNQVVKLDPKHREASKKLADAGRQARLAALYAAACRALEAGRWQEVVDELSEVISVEPRYRDAAELLQRAQAAQEKANIAQTVSGLYDKGVAHVAAREWEEAARCFRRVQQLSPGYKDSRSLLADAERHVRPGARWLLGMGMSSSRRVAPLVTLVLILSVIIGGAYYFFSQRGRASVAAELATRVSEDPTPVYQEAQAAMESGDWDKAIELFDALLAQDPDFTEARALRDQAVTNRALDQSFGRAEAAYDEERWDDAIDILSGLHEADNSYRSTDVQDLLCNAHLRRGETQVAAYTEDSDIESLETAQEDFKTGLSICPDEDTLIVQNGYLESFLRAWNAQSSRDYNTLIRTLAPLVATEPGYGGGNARRMLYAALVARGDIRQQAGDLAGALADYEQALALDQSDDLDAASRRSQVLRGLNAEEPPLTPRPQATEVLTPSPYKYVAPAPLSPPNGAVFSGQFTAIVLKWGSVGTLAGDEYYDVTVMHYVAGQPRYWGGAVKGTEWQVPVEAGYNEAANDEFFWWVTVRQANTAAGPGQLDAALSPTGATATFYWGD
jgi:tetratricopeptide (TPR) repeat protein/predicted Ser/Thr protein kinase